jgi:predicted nucleic acid-binding protein
LIVVDASVLVEFLLGRRHVLAAVTHELSGELDEALHAPELIEPEAMNALRRLLRGGEVNASQADRAVSELEEVRLIRYPHAPLRSRVWELRHNLSAYDAVYLALAEMLDESVLITGDAGLAANASAALGEDRVRYLVREGSPRI